ncbi:MULTISPECIES: S41 family peptidase [unclassified Psychrobacter]|uniref:S41 family peptidase n=1 Tax=unclassified Psychrobacter TaxID=196806 RepID=UPI000B2741DF|nr:MULTISPECIES: S41 family peptidase [unclassified Psychrobacter]PKG68043.1 S41 family peptidase [Psychrobacter sp. Choline-02u-13]PKH55327.1 S41 family peptidase [Psychrobacter sp. Choline-02u-9]
MQPISFARSFLSKGLSKSVWKASVVSKVLQPAILIGVLGCAISVNAQAAVGASTNSDNPTNGLQLISLNADEIADEKDADNLSNIADMLDVADEPDDSIDSVPDESALTDDADDIDTDIPAEVAQVSLNAISPETLKTFVAVVDLIRRQYVDAVNDEELFSNAMSGMLTKLDSHAEFLDAEAYENLRAFTEGDVGDIGIKVNYRPEAGYWVVTEVIDDSPADRKGIAVGDYLHQVDEFKLDDGRQVNDVEQLLTGIAGTQVDIITSKAGRRKHTTTLQRNNSHPQIIETKLVDGIAIVKLPAFQNNSREKLLEGLINLNAPISGILLDVRDNPGGVLTSAVSVASLFMDDTDVVQVQARQNKSRVLSTQGDAILKPLPLVVLQNRYSASAAEVLASSLQAQKRATIIGEVSYGKGSVQSVIPLNDEQAVKLTVANYMTVAGKQIDEIGVEPDVTLSGNENTWEQQALELVKARALDSGIRFVRKNATKE